MKKLLPLLLLALSTSTYAVMPTEDKYTWLEAHMTPAEIKEHNEVMLCDAYTLMKIKEYEGYHKNLQYRLEDLETLAKNRARQGA